MTWSRVVKLHELARGPLRMDLEPDAEQREAIARQLGLRGLPELSARVTVKPWLDGVELTGRFDAVVTQICGVTLDPFDQPLAGEFEVRAVPAGSPHAAASVAPPGGHLELDPEADDAPDLMDGDAVDVAAYVTEHLALEIDPFPRKPDAEFHYESPQAETSPFAALKALKPNEP